MTSHDCKYYDKENGWCKYFSDWSSDMPDIEYCIQSPCSQYQPKTNRIIIDAKHSIGDKIWFTDYFYDEFSPCKYYGEINEIEVEITESKQKIYYWVVVDYNGSKEYEKYAEEMCFSTYEECTKWCNEHNRISVSLTY